MASQLRKLLDKEAGWEEFRMIIPHPFLPPRFQKSAKNRNMILLLDRDMTLHIRWEGARLHEHHPLTPQAARRLIEEVLGYMTKYRRELKVFSRFIGEWGEQPFDDPRAMDPLRLKEREAPSASLEVREEVRVHETLRAGRLPERMRGMGRGGESPMGENFE